MEAETWIKKYFLSQVMCPLLYTDGKETRTIYRQFVELRYMNF